MKFDGYDQRTLLGFFPVGMQTYDTTAMKHCVYISNDSPALLTMELDLARPKEAEQIVLDIA